MSVRIALFCLMLSFLASAETLPFATVFRGESKFNDLVSLAQRENWKSLPLSERMGKVALALRGTPYQNYTLEIDDHIEAASVDLNAFDCWTFFETTLAFARMLPMKDSGYTPQDLLKLIEMDRYKGGHCQGYLTRLHFLEQWSADNQSRGLVKNITQELGGVKMHHRDLTEMTDAYKSYRYLASDHSLIPGIAEVQSQVSDLPVYFIPKSDVPDIEPRLQTGDVICIVTSDPSSYTSHVGLAYRDEAGLLHFMHATSSYDKGRRVIIDGRLSDYLRESSTHIGVMVVRPLDVPSSMPPMAMQNGR